MFAKCSGAWPTISTAGHTGIPVGTEATNAELAIDAGAGSNGEVLATEADCSSIGGLK